MKTAFIAIAILLVLWMIFELILRFAKLDGKSAGILLVLKAMAQGFIIFIFIGMGLYFIFR